MEATENRHQVAKKSQFDLANEGLRDACVTELCSREQSSSNMFMKLKGWK